MMSRTLFRLVNDVASEHCLNGLFELSFFCEADQQSSCFCIQQILGIIEQQFFPRQRKVGIALPLGEQRVQ